MMNRTMASVEHAWPIPMKAIGAQNLLTMPGGVTISGYLHKRGGTQIQLFSWPLRFVIIHKGCVYYFKSSTSASSQGAFSLNGYNRVMRAAEETTSNNVFPFKIVHISKKHRTWYFSAASENERKDWMSSLRKEIANYHEKKETELSDPESDADSFYGSVERPVAITYNQSTEDNEGSMQGSDDDDDLDEYEEPDVDDLVNSSVPPPNYPPPPPPEHLDSPRRSHCPGVFSKTPPPLPSPNKTVSVMEPTNVWKGPSQPHLKIPSTLPHTRSSEPPPVPPISYKKKVALDKTIANTCQAPKHVAPSTNACIPSPSELGMKLKSINMSPHGPPPIPPTKPKAIQTDRGSEPPMQREHSKPALFKPPVLPKPQPVLPKLQPVLKPAVSPLQRSSPDGQSFREFPFEKQKPFPRYPKEQKQSDSDEDYEKVPLPSSVFVKTTDSCEVERIMKDNCAGRCPVNGLYCIRNSTKSGQVLVVWDEAAGKVRNYRLFEKSCKMYIEDCCAFPDLEALVEYYHTHVLPNHGTLILQQPFGYAGPR